MNADKKEVVREKSEKLAKTKEEKEREKGKR